MKTRISQVDFRSLKSNSFPVIMQLTLLSMPFLFHINFHCRYNEQTRTPSVKQYRSKSTEGDGNEVADGEEVGGDAVDEEESDAETAELIGRYDSNQDGEINV